MRGLRQVLVATGLIVAAALAGGAAQAAELKVLTSFGFKLGTNPMGPVLIDSAGNLFGTASQAGPQLGGTVYELKRKGGGYKAISIFRFCIRCGTGSQPNGPLIIDTQGNLYGVTGGFPGHDGVAFELSPVPGQKIWSEKILYQFCSQPSCTDGDGPVGGLTYAGASSGAPYDGTSPLYGATAGGGANNGGALFQLTNTGGSWSESVLYSFCSQGGDKCLDGTEPAAGVVLDLAGNLYGTTKFGGGNNVGSSHAGAGVVYELTPNGADGWQQTILHRFCTLSDCGDGAVPFAPLVLDAEGNLLGTTGFGGRKCSFSKQSGCGTIFEIVPDGESSQEIVLYAFCAKRDCRDGLTPEAGLLAGQDGTIFGTTVFGGGHDSATFVQGAGVAFKLSGADLQVLHAFCSSLNCADGAEPDSEVIIDSSGKLYGTTSLGGDFEVGSLFEIRP